MSASIRSEFVDELILVHGRAERAADAWQRDLDAASRRTPSPDVDEHIAYYTGKYEAAIGLRDLWQMLLDASEAVTQDAGFIAEFTKRLTGRRPATAVETVASPEELDVRDGFVDGLRALADFLESRPNVPVSPFGETINVPLTTNAALLATAEAARETEKVATDAMGNTSLTFAFGQVKYHLYGYADFDATRDRLNEDTARTWAQDNGMALVPDREVEDAYDDAETAAARSAFAADHADELAVSS